MTTTCITLTGDRPVAFGLCQKWMAAQTIKCDQWVVVEDGKVPMREPFTPLVTHIRREPQKNDPAVTMLLNLKEALKVVTGDYILVWEDDEYYHPTYIEEMVKRLKSHEAVGIGNSKYYHLAGGYLTHGNMNHASFAQTAFRKEKIPILESTFDGDSFIDMRFWKKAKGFIFDDGEKNPLYVGIKGLPGRPGIGQGHLFNSNYKPDADRKVLRKWIPKDYPVYLDIIKKVQFGKMKLNTNKGGNMGNYIAINQGGFIPANSKYKSSVYGRINPGTVFEYDGPKGMWMAPVDAPGNKIIPVEDLPIYEAAKKISESHGLPSLEETVLDSKPKLKGRK
jgi:hypothetical protein